MRAYWRKEEWVLGVLLFLSGKLLYFFLGLCDYSHKFPKMFCSSCGGECPSTANFYHQGCQQLNFSQVSNKAASSVNEEKLLKKYFHRGYPYAAIVSLLEIRDGVRMRVRMPKTKLKDRPRMSTLYRPHVKETGTNKWREHMYSLDPMQFISFLTLCNSFHSHECGKN